MAKHLQLHSFTGNTDHDFTGLVSGQPIILDGIGLVSTTTLTGLTSVSATTFYGDGSNLTGIKYTITTGFTSSVPLTITHNLNTEDVVVNIWENSPKIQTDGTIEVIDSDNIIVTMASTATFKVVIIG